MRLCRARTRRPTYRQNPQVCRTWVSSRLSGGAPAWYARASVLHGAAVVFQPGALRSACRALVSASSYSLS